MSQQLYLKINTAGDKNLPLRNKRYLFILIYCYIDLFTFIHKKYKTNYVALFKQHMSTVNATGRKDDIHL